MSHYLAQILEKVAPNIKIVPPRETATRINQRGLSTEYGQMRMDSDQSNILNAASLKKIGTAIAVRYVFQPRLAAFTQLMQDRWVFPAFGLRLVQTRSSTLRLTLQLWDTETGELVWTSVAEVILSSEAVSQDPVFLEDAARVALGSVITDFLHGKTASTYTPLNEILDQLIQKPAPEKTPASPEVNQPQKK